MTAIAKTDGLSKGLVSKLIEENRAELMKVLPKHVTFDRMAKVLLYCIDADPNLLKCTQSSLFGAIKILAELGLEPGAARGHAYLIAYKVGGRDTGRNCQLVLGYKGLLHLARRSGMTSDVEARVVHQNDKFDVAFGLHPRLEHIPALVNPGAPIAVYCLARGKDMEHVELMTWGEVQRIKNLKPLAADSPWHAHEEEQARKTVIRRWAKSAELSPEMADAMLAEDRSREQAERATVIVEAAAMPVRSVPRPLDVGEEDAHIEPPAAPPTNPPETAAAPAAPQPAPSPPKAAPSDPLAVEVATLSAAIAAAETKEALDALRKRLSALPEKEKTALRCDYQQRVESLKARAS